MSEREYMALWAYVDGKKRKVGYGYLTEKGSLCIKGDEMIDKTKLGRMLMKGLYVVPPESSTAKNGDNQAPRRIARQFAAN